MKTLYRVCSIAAMIAFLAACGGKNEEATKTSVASDAMSSVPECKAYMERISKCMDKLGSDSPMTATIKQQLEEGSKWAATQDKAMLASSCKRSNELFNQSAQMLKCE